MIYPSYKRPIEYIMNDPYLVYAKIPIERVKNVVLVKEWLGVDTAFKVQREGTYWFCESIPDIPYEEC